MKKENYAMHEYMFLIHANNDIHNIINLIHCYNTCLSKFWVDHMDGYALYANQSFMFADVQETSLRFIDFFNKSDRGHWTIALLAFLEKIKPGDFKIQYPNQMLYYDDNLKTFHPPTMCFCAIQEILGMKI